jgi:hypothetical protein
MYLESSNKAQFFCHISKRFKFSRQIFIKPSSIKFRENQSWPGGGGLLSHAENGRKDVQMDEETDMTKLITNFHNFAKAPKTCGRLVENI